MNITTSEKKQRTLKSFLLNNTDATMLLAVLLLIVIFTILSPVFFSWTNLLNLGVYASLSGILACGCMCALIIGALDVSQWSAVALLSIAVAILNNAHIPGYLIILITLVLGIALGAVNGIIVTKMKISPIIATMGTMMIFRALAYIIAGGKYMILDDPIVIAVGRGNLFGVPSVIWILIIIYVMFWFILNRTPFGRKMLAVGGNAQASYLAGIKQNSVRFNVFLLSGFTSGLTAVLFAGQFGAGMPQAGASAGLDVIAAVILGGISLTGGKGKITGTFLGVIFLSLISNGMSLLSVQSFYQDLVRGICFIVAVFIDTLRGGGYR